MFRKDFEHKHVLITGGLGFIGSRLAIRLARMGAKVTVVDSLIPQYGGNLFNLNGFESSIRVNISDVRDETSFAFLIKDKDFLFNLAGQTSHIDSMNDPVTDLKINSEAQLLMLEACRKINPTVKIVFASTRQIYGRPQYLPVDEKHPIVPVDVNGINKLSGEWYHILYSKVYGINACALRLTNTYGPGMRVKDARQTFLGIWIKNLICGIPMQVFGDGLQLRDFNYVDDAVDAFLIAAASRSSNGQVYNLGSDEVINLKNLAETLCALHSKGEFSMIPFPEDRKSIDIGDYYSDFQKIKNELGWSPKVRLKEGLLETLSYYTLNKQHYWESSIDLNE